MDIENTRHILCRFNLIYYRLPILYWRVNKKTINLKSYNIVLVQLESENLVLDINYIVCVDDF